MKKRFFAFISAALILSGCSVITDGEYRYSEPHSSSPPRYSDASAVIELASSLMQSFLTLLSGT